ncbi:MAG: hypothetical protein NTW61_02130 [Candidatus Melainabacteria bacterium]|nr:hypothetical protein [Candidatus Melainabacteria bacterium]
MKEAIQAISQIVNAGVLNGDFAGITDWTLDSPTDPLVKYFTDKLGGVSKQCVKGDTAGFCNTYHSIFGPTHFLTNHSGRWVLMNGITISLCGDDGSGINLDGRHLVFIINSAPTTNAGLGKQTAVVWNISDTPVNASSFRPQTPSNILNPGQCNTWWAKEPERSHYSPTWEELYS